MDDNERFQTVCRELSNLNSARFETNNLKPMILFCMYLLYIITELKF